MLTTKETDLIAEVVVEKLMQIKNYEKSQERMQLPEAAKFLAMSEAWLRKKVQRREVRAYKQGRRLIFLRSDLELLRQQAILKS